MKKVTLLVLFYSLIINVLSAQQLLTDIKSNTQNWPRMLAAAMQKAGLEMPQQHTLRPSVETRTVLQLDSTKTFYGFGIPTASDSTPLYRSIYEYPAEGVKIEKNAWFEDNKWNNTERISYFYDPQGRLVELLAETWEETQQAWKPDSRLEQFPHHNSQNLLDSFFVWQWEPGSNNWVLLTSAWYEYDNEDRLMVSYSTLDVFGQPLVFKDVHAYDTNGDNTTVMSFVLIDDQEVLIGMQDKTFQNHELTEVIVSGVDDMNGVFPQSRQTFTYTTTGQQSETHLFEWNPESDGWRETEGNWFEYDNADRTIMAEKRFYLEDGTEDRQQTVYTYLQDELLAVEEIRLWDGIDYFLSDRKFFYYSEKTASVDPINTVHPLIMSPNPSTGSVQINLESVAQVQVFSTEGRLVNSSQLNPGSTLNLHDLPAGLYIVRAVQGKKVFSGRLVKE